MHARIEDREAGLAVRLGHVHRHVGVAHQLLRVAAGVAARWRYRCWRSRVMVWSPITYGTRRSRTSRSAMARDRRRSGSSSVRMANSSPPRRATRSPLAHEAADALGHRDEERVAGRVAERVVDDLEVVEVDEQDRGHRLAARMAPCGQRPLQRQLEHAPVGGSGQRVALGEVLHVAAAGRRSAGSARRPRENWPSTDATRRSIPKTVRDRCSTTIAPTGRPSAIIGETSRLPRIRQESR